MTHAGRQGAQPHPIMLVGKAVQKAAHMQAVRNHTCRQSGRQSEPQMQAVRKAVGTTHAGSPEPHMQAVRNHICRQSGNTHAGSPEAHMQAVRNHTCRQSGSTHAGSPEPHMQAVRNHTCRQSGIYAGSQEPHMQAVRKAVGTTNAGSQLVPKPLPVLPACSVTVWCIQVVAARIWKKYRCH